MTYYCDNKRHLVCLPYSIPNLHAMAKDLGIGRHWFHNKKGLAHYDIPKRKMQEIRLHSHVVTTSIIIIIIRGRELGVIASP